MVPYGYVPNMYLSTEFFSPGSNSKAPPQVKDQAHSYISYLNKVTGLSKKIILNLRHPTIVGTLDTTTYKQF